MAITQDIRKAAIDNGYAAAGALDLGAEKIGQFVTEAPGRLEQLRKTDPKALGERVTKGAKEAQEQITTKATAFFGSLDTDVKKLGQTGQDLLLQGVGLAVAGVAKAGETRDRLAERGREAVKTWRGEQGGEAREIPVATEPGTDEPAPRTGAAEDKAEEPAAKPAARRAATRKPAARKTDARATDE